MALAYPATLYTALALLSTAGCARSHQNFHTGPDPEIGLVQTVYHRGPTAKTAWVL